MTLQPNETDYVTIKLVNDDVWERNELFTLAISGSSVGGGVNDTVVKIIDEDRKYRQIVLVNIMIRLFNITDFNNVIVVLSINPRIIIFLVVRFHELPNNSNLLPDFFKRSNVCVMSS